MGLLTLSTGAEVPSPVANSGSASSNCTTDSNGAFSIDCVVDILKTIETKNVELEIENTGLCGWVLQAQNQSLVMLATTTATICSSCRLSLSNRDD